MPEREDIHACWSLTPQFDKMTGELTTAGLLALGGHGGDGAVRELKKRCDAELERAGKPLVGCAMYVNLIAGWANTALDYKERLKGTEVIVNYAADKSFRKGFERSFRLTGEDEIADLIEETWAQYQKEEDIPDGVRMDVEDEIKAILEDKYCHVGLEPPDFTPEEIVVSKAVALNIGKRARRRRNPTVEPAPEETPEEPESETEPEPPGKTTVKTEAEMRDEIRANMKRA